MAKKIVALLLSVVMALSLLTACGNTETKEPEAEKATKEPVVEEKEASEDEQITIKMCMNYGGSDSATELSLYEAIERFEEKYPNVTVELEKLSEEDYHVKLQVYAASDALPDVFRLKGNSTAIMARDGQVGALTDIIANDPELSVLYRDGMLDEFTYEGEVYGLPYLFISVSLLYYNEEILKDCGYDSVPQTWSEFMTLCEKIKEKGIIPLCFGNNEAWPIGASFYNDVQAKNSSEWFNKLMNKEAKFTDEEVVEAFKLIGELYDKGYINSDCNSLPLGEQDTLFMNEECAMFMHGSWMVNVIENSYSQEMIDKMGIAFLPMMDGGDSVYESIPARPGWSNAASKKSLEDPVKGKYVVELLKEISGAEYGTRLSTLGDIAPMNLDVDVSNVGGPLFQEYYQMLDGATFHPIFNTVLEASVVDVYQKGLQDLMFGSITAEELAQKTQDAFEAVYGK